MATTVVAPPNELSFVPAAGTPCPNCGSTMVAEYCARCGEQQPAHRDLSIGAVAHDTLQEFVGVDGKVPRTVWALVTKPGVLTREFIDGRRGRYTKPLSLFVVLNLIFFLIQPHTGLLRYSLDGYVGGDADAHVARAALVKDKVLKSHESASAYAMRFNDTLADQKKSMLLFAVPVFAVAMVVVFAGTKRYFVEHLVFAVHAYAFLLALLAVGITLIFYAIRGWVSIASLAGFHANRLDQFLSGELGLIVVLLASITTYLTLAIRRTYGGPMWAALGRAVALAIVQMYLIIVYRDILFYTTLYST